MRYIVFALVLGMFVGCAPANRSTYTVHGTIGEEVTVMLFTTDFRTYDTVKVEQGKFAYTGKAVEFVQYVTTDNRNIPNRKFFVEGGEKLNIDYNDGIWNISGSTLNNDYSALDKQIAGYRDQIEMIFAEHRKIVFTIPEGERRQLTIKTRKSTNEIKDTITRIATDYISLHPDSPLSVALLWEYHLNNWRGLTDLYDALTAKAKTIPLAAEVERVAEQKRISTPDNMIPSFMAKDAEGNDFNIESLKGKYVYIDFWATWCAPCMMELPHIKEMWHALKGKDLVIIMISQDKSEQSWRDCIAQERMEEWINILDEEGTLMEKLGVRGIPANFLLDGNGYYLQRGFDSERTDLIKEVGQYLVPPTIKNLSKL